MSMPDPQLTPEQRELAALLDAANGLVAVIHTEIMFPGSDARSNKIDYYRKQIDGLAKRTREYRARRGMPTGNV